MQSVELVSRDVAGAFPTQPQRSTTQIATEVSGAYACMHVHTCITQHAKSPNGVTFRVAGITARRKVSKSPCKVMEAT